MLTHSAAIAPWRQKAYGEQINRLFADFELPPFTDKWLVQY
jgi:hypothetical protein